jgi:hypothetical protein
MLLSGVANIGLELINIAEMTQPYQHLSLACNSVYPLLTTGMLQLAAAPRFKYCLSVCKPSLRSLATLCRCWHIMHYNRICSPWQERSILMSGPASTQLLSC